MWGEKKESVFRLGHFVSPLLTSVAAAKVGENEPLEGSLRNPGLETTDGHRLHCCSACTLAVFAHLPLPFILTTPWVAYWGWFSSRVFLMNEPKWRESKQHTVHWHMPVKAEHPGPPGSNPAVFPLNQLFPGAGYLGERPLNFLPRISPSSCLHLWSKENPLGCFWMIYVEDIAFLSFELALLCFGFCVYWLFPKKVV